MASRLMFFCFFIIFLLGCSKGQKETVEIDDRFVLIDNCLERAQDKSLSLQIRKEEVKKALNLLENEEGDIGKRKKLTKVSVVYLNLRDSLNFVQTINQSIKLSRKIKDSSGIASNYNNYAIFYKRLNMMDSAYYYHSKAEKLYSKMQIENNYSQGTALLGMAIIQIQKKDYTGSTANIIDAIKKFEASKDKDPTNYLSICYSHLGIASNNLGLYKEAIEYHEKSMEYAESLKHNDLKKILAFNNIGIILKNQRKYHEAIDYYNKALEYTDYLNKDRKRYALLIDNLNYMKFLAGQRDDVEESFLESLRIRDSLGDKSGTSINTLHLAEYYSKLGKKDLAKKYGKLSEKISKSIKYNANLLESYRILSEVNTGDKGLAYSKAYIKLNDSLVREERQFRDKIARIQFETEEKEEQIEEKEQQIAAVESQNTIYLLGMLLLVMAITFAIYFFRQRTKYLAQQNQMVQFQASYETETRISKRLHDELGNDIFQVMLQYQNDPHDSQILEKLNTTYARARDISRENNEFDIDESFPEELSDMLKNYTKNGIQLLVRGLDKINWQGFEAPVKITVYRVLQELMTNMQKHSQASMVVLVFNQDNNTLHIKYTDNGVGIDKTQLQSKNGLHNTEKRIRAIDGTLIFESEKEKGFKADIKIPA